MFPGEGTENQSSEESCLVSRWQHGDSSAAQELLTRHYGALTRFFQNKVGCSDAEDLVQETMAAVMASSERFEGRSTFKAYMLSIARLRLYECYRKKRRDQQVFEFDTVTVFDLSSSPSVCAAQRSEQRLLLEALRRIPLNSQIVLELHYWEDLSGTEIADAVGLPVDTAYSRLRKAKALLKRKLEVLANSKELLESTCDRLDVWANSLRQQCALASRGETTSPI